MADPPWYRNGLRFACTRCGQCCGGGPGTIRVNEEEIATLAETLGLSDAAFRKRYTRRLRGGDISLIEKNNHDCIFYDDELGCTVYVHRPRQCRTWPFWDSTAGTPEDWEETCRACPGCGKGPLVPVEEIVRGIKVIHV